MILVKVRKGNFEGIINLDFVKTMYIDYDSVKDEYLIKAVYGNNDIAIIDRCNTKGKAHETLGLISRAVLEEVKVIYLNVKGNERK